MNKEIIAHQSISDIPGIGPVKAKKILDNLSSYDSEYIFSAVVKAFPLAKIDNQSWQSIQLKAEDKVLRMLDAGVSIISYLSKSYPSQLKELSDPPINLYIVGDVSSIMGSRNIAIIGTRHPSKHIQDLAPNFCQYISQKASCIVSGLAIGCDTIAHQACINASRPTAAILPCGIDQIYPKKNTGLADKIKASGGCLISEYEPGIKPQKSYFVARDRIQAGLSHAVALLQSSDKGGSMHAIKTMKSLNRPCAVISVPPDQIKYNQWSGSLQLITRNQCTTFDLTCDTSLLRKTIDSFLNQQISNKESKDFEQGSLF